MTSHAALDVDRIAATNEDRLHSRVGMRACQSLDVQILVVGRRICHRPCHIFGLREVGNARHTGEREARSVDARVIAAQADLEVDVRALERTVRITGDER